ncbi:MAG: sensor histidine kinase [Anaerolineae bacterium]
MRELIDRSLEVKTTDPMVARRARLLNIVLLGFLIVSLLLLVIILFFLWRDPNILQGSHLLAVLGLSQICFFAIYLINRYLSTRLAAILFVLINLFAASVADTPTALSQEHSILSFTVPIVVASMFLHPLAGFGAAAFAFGVVMYYSLMIGEIPPYPSMLIFLIIALISWLTTDDLEHSLEETRLLNQELDQRVEDRTQELREANEALQIRNEELDAFAHSVAHDIKTPLTTIYGFSRLLTRRYPELPAEELGLRLSNIASNSNRVCKIVDELLLLATVRKMDDIPIVPLDMGAIVAAAQERLADTITEYEAEMVLPATWPTACGYAPWIEEVWANYLSNAIKYGGRPPRIVLGATKTNNAHISFWVQDNGVGLTEEECARLFTPFTRLDQVSVKGHGLGLSIVRRIVERLGGEVYMESEVGVGSRFSFTLPQDVPSR